MKLFPGHPLLCTLFKKPEAMRPRHDVHGRQIHFSQRVDAKLTKSCRHNNSYIHNNRQFDDEKLVKIILLF